MRALTQGAGGGIFAVGSTTLGHTLLRHGHVDERRMTVFPVAIGRGLRVFLDEQTEQQWTLAELRRYPAGVLALGWSPA